MSKFLEVAVSTTLFIVLLPVLPCWVLIASFILVSDTPISLALFNSSGVNFWAKTVTPEPRTQKNHVKINLFIIAEDYILSN